MRIASIFLTVAALALVAGCSTSTDVGEVASPTPETAVTLSETSQVATSTTTTQPPDSGMGGGGLAPSNRGDDLSSQSSVAAAEEAAKLERDKEWERLAARAEEINSEPLADDNDGQFNDAAFISTLDITGVHYSSEAGAIRLAETICSNFDSGMSALDIAMAILASGQYSPEQTASMLGAATGVYCPEYEHLLSA